MGTPDPPVDSPGTLPDPASHRLPWFAAIASGTLINMALGALDNTPGLALSLGVYAGEYLILAIWVSWGTGAHLRRINIILWTGILWMLAGWIGFGFVDFLDFFAMQEMFKVGLFAFAISTFPLWIMRIWNWRFHGTSTVAHHASSLNWSGIAALAVVMSFCFIEDSDVIEYLILSAMLGPLFGALAMSLAPLLTLAFLGNRVNMGWLLPAMVLAAVYGYVSGSALARGAAMYGPDAFARSLALIFSSFCALFATSVAFFFWRSMGIRHSEQSVCRDLQSIHEGTNGESKPT